MPSNEKTEFFLILLTQIFDQNFKIKLAIYSSLNFGT